MIDTSTRRMAEPAVEVEGLGKRYGTVAALGGVNLAIPQGCVYAVLGPNGAGKTTLIHILTTLVRPSAGRARVLGHDVVAQAAAVRRHIGLTAQFASLDEDLTAVENLTLLARLHGYPRRPAHARAAALLTAFDLSAAGRRRVATFSGGMRRRLDLAASLVVTPEVLFLDEPTTGLDPHSRNALWQVVRTVVASGATVVLTTQYLEEADQLADRIAVVDRGVVVAEGTRAQVKASIGAERLRVRLADPGDRAEAQRLLSTSLGAAALPDSDPATVTATLPTTTGVDPAVLVSRALAHLTEAGVDVSDFSFGQPSLDEVFLTLTSHRTPAELRPNGATREGVSA